MNGAPLLQLIFNAYERSNFIDFLIQLNNFDRSIIIVIEFSC